MLRNSFLSTWTGVEMLHQYQHCFSLKIGNLTESPSLSCKHAVHERLALQSNEVWNIKGSSKIPIFEFLCELGIQTKLLFKKFSFPSFSWIERILELHAKINTQSFQCWLYGWIWKIYVLIQVLLLKIRLVDSIK